MLSTFTTTSGGSPESGLTTRLPPKHRISQSIIKCSTVPLVPLSSINSLSCSPHSLSQASLY